MMFRWTPQVRRKLGTLARFTGACSAPPDPDSLPQLQDFIERGRAGAEGQDGYLLAMCMRTENGEGLTGEGVNLRREILAPEVVVEGFVHPLQAFVHELRSAPWRG